MEIKQRLIDHNFGQIKNRKVVRIVIHTQDGSPNGKLVKDSTLFHYFNNPKTKKSSHYFVKRNGIVEQYVRDEDVAWHTDSKRNVESIGIEHEDWDDYAKESSYTKEQVEASAQLQARLWKKFGRILTPSRHNEFNKNKACPGAFPWRKAYNRAREIYFADDVEKKRAEYVKELESKAESLKKSVEKLENQIQNTVYEKNVELANYQKQLEDAKKELQELGTREIDPIIGSLIEEIILEEVKTSNLKQKWHDLVHRFVPWKVLQSVLLYDWFYVVFSTLSFFLMQIAQLPIDTKLAGGLSLVIGVILKLLITNYDKNKDGKIDLEDTTYLKELVN